MEGLKKRQALFTFNIERSQLQELTELGILDLIDLNLVLGCTVLMNMLY